MTSPNRTDLGPRLITATHSDLGTSSLQELIANTRSEIAAFADRQPTDGRYGLELFRRALAERQERSWNALVDLYGGQVRRWVRQHPRFPPLAVDVDDIAIPSFCRLWKAVPATRMMFFNSLCALLQFLKLCVHSEIMQALRDRMRFQRLEQIHPDAEDDDPWDRLLEGSGLVGSRIENVSDRQQLWTAVGRQLNDDQEQVVVEWTYAIGLPPREIARLNPHLFDSAAEVSRIKENVLRRLRRSTVDGEIVAVAGRQDN